MLDLVPKPWDNTEETTNAKITLTHPLKTYEYKNYKF